MLTKNDWFSLEPFGYSLYSINIFGDIKNIETDKLLSDTNRTLKCSKTNSTKSIRKHDFIFSIFVDTKKFKDEDFPVKSKYTKNLKHCRSFTSRLGIDVVRITKIPIGDVILKVDLLVKPDCSIFNNNYHTKSLFRPVVKTSDGLAFEIKRNNGRYCISKSYIMELYHRKGVLMSNKETTDDELLLVHYICQLLEKHAQTREITKLTNASGTLIRNIRKRLIHKDISCWYNW